MDSQKVLVVVSHGSKCQESKQEFKNFIQKLNEINSENKKRKEFESLSGMTDQVGKSDSRGSYVLIRGACLEFASPQLETVIEDLVKKGYEQFNIFPLFIFAGYHVLEDIPQRLEKLKAEFEQLQYNVLPHPAAADDFAPYILNNVLNNKAKINPLNYFDRI